MKILNNRKSLARAVRLVVESLESRRLLTSVSSIDFDASGTDQHLSVTFDGPVVAATMPPATVVNLTQFAANVPLQTPTLSAGQTVATYKPIANPLTNGWYESYVHDAAATVADDPELTFSVLSTDFNSDGVVNFNDFLVLQNNFGQSGKTFADGDANYDHVVNFNDYLALQNSFGLSLPDLPNNAGGVVVANTTAHALDVGWTVNDTQPRDGFKVYRSDDGGATYNLVQTLGDPDARAWQDVGENDDIGTPLITGHKYWYRVRAFTIEAGASASVTRAWGIPTDTTAASPFSASVNPSTVAPNEPFTLTLSATAAEAPAVTAWKITWQNGDTQTLTAGPDSSNATQSNWLLTHAYAISGQHFIIIQAQDATGWHDPIGVTVNVTNTPPQVAGTDSYTTSTTSAAISVTGTDDGGAQHLNYQWSVENAPTGGTVSFSPASGHSANSTTANFSKAGDYLLTVTATDTFGLASDPFEVSVSVLQAPQYVDLSPYSANLNLGATKQFTAYAFDQFDQQISGPDVTWSADHGTIDASGFYTATGASLGGTDTVHVALASDPSNYADASINVHLPAPSGLTASAANETEVNLAWSDNSIGESGFVIERSDDGGNTFATIITTPPNATAWSAIGLAPDASYRFRITAICNGMTSGAANVASVKMPLVGAPVREALGTVTPVIDSKAISYFAGSQSFPAGTYYVKYMRGGLDYAGGSIPTTYYASYGPGYSGWYFGYQVVTGTVPNPYSSATPVAIFPGYASIAALENANAGRSYTITTTSAGPIGVYLEDQGFYGGDTPNQGPGATFELERLKPPPPAVPAVSIAPTNEVGSADAWEVPLGTAGDKDNLLKFTVTRTGSDANGDLDQPLAVSLHPPADAAKSGDDYTGFQGSVTIPAHQNSVDFTVTAKPDDKTEANEMLALCLKAGANYRLGTYTASGTIHDVSASIDLNAGLPEVTEETQGLLVPLNDNFDEQNHDGNGELVPDNQKAFIGGAVSKHRMVPNDPQLYGATLNLTPPSGIAGTWKLDYNNTKILVWQYRNEAWDPNPVEPGQAYSTSGNSSVQLKIEGIAVSSAKNDASVTAKFFADPVTSPTPLATDTVNFTVVKAEVHPLDSDYGSSVTKGRVLDYTLPTIDTASNRYATVVNTTVDDKPAQTSDLTVTATVQFAGIDPAILVGKTVYLKVIDIPDASPYALHPAEGDNHAPMTAIQKRNFKIATATIVRAHINGRDVAAAERLVFLNKPGDNYVVEASTDPDFKTVLGHSDSFVTWHRVYLEQDEMFRHGTYATSPRAADSNSDPDILIVQDTTDFNAPHDGVAGTAITVVSPTGELGTTVVLAKTSTTLTVADLSFTVKGYDAVVPTDDMDKYGKPSITADLDAAYGNQSDSRTAGGGAFIEFRENIGGSGAFPRVRGATMNNGDGGQLADYWFKTKDTEKANATAGQNLLHIITSAPAEFTVETRDHFFVTPIGLAFYSKATEWNYSLLGNVEAHEIGHLLGLSHDYPWVDANVLKPTWNDPAFNDIMSYASPWNGELSVDSLYILRGWEQVRP